MAHRVLIVEDDPLISRMYQNVFQFEGFEVDMARNGEEGLDKVTQHPPRMILLDVMMPKMTGLEMLQILKENPRTKGIPVVVLTNLSGINDAEKALGLGAVKFIVKSKNKPKQIVEQIKEILKAYSREDVPSAATA